MNDSMFNLVLTVLALSSIVGMTCAIWTVYSRDRYIRKLEQRVRTLTLRVWESKDELKLGRTFVPVYMTDDTEPEHLNGVITKEQP